MTAIANETSRLAPHIFSHSPIYMDVGDVSIELNACPILLAISDEPDVSLNFVAGLDDVGGYNIDQEFAYVTLDEFSYYEFFNMEPIINIPISPLSDNILVSFGLEKQHLFMSTDGKSDANADS
ncbi:hypothetical protein MA16_Dca022308 [Dendrobium catenatum]|uniref:Uncharacterized protein n=1 Tax=Dendrobium catenatum TaxID=906689 RepID=A0A2I0XAZ3_9ASPA|nr:hypothetical protein MA16_Dca022308 [Dendrobium catenatum]